jgi:hypothetical protein
LIGQLVHELTRWQAGRERECLTCPQVDHVRIAGGPRGLPQRGGQVVDLGARTG